METLLVKKPIYQHDAPLDTPQQWEEETAQAFTTWGKFFKNKEEFEFFWMLPIDQKQREQLIRDLWEEKCRRLEIMSCQGKEGSTPEHRADCFECCVLYKPEVAKPYFS